MIVHSRDGAIPRGAEKFHTNLAGARKLIWASGNQFDFYDHEPTVTAAVAVATRHFAETLG